MAKKIVVSCVLVLVTAGTVFWLVGRQGDDGQTVDRPERVHRPQGVRTEKPTRSGMKSGTKTRKSDDAGRVTTKAVVTASEKNEPDVPAAETEEENEVDEETALADAFDSLTDKWMEPSKKGVAMEDIQHFAEQFRKLPKAKKDECLHRALNLIPDENVMLLAGVLMDKTLDKEYLDMVYNDVLNRDENVKKPILQQIFKDREHPCWADTAWILDVTGELPAKTGQK